MNANPTCSDDVPMNRMKLHIKLMMGALLAFSMVMVWPALAPAQPKTARVVVLKVPGDRTQTVVDTVKTVEGVTIKRQEWFLNQIQTRGFNAKGIMKRPDDLKWLMKGSEIDYILFLARKDDTTLEARVVPRETGKIAHRIDIEESGGSLVATDVLKIKTKFEDLLGITAERKKAEELKKQKELEAKKKEEASRDYSAYRERATKEKAEKTEALKKNWLIAAVRGSMLRRDFSVSGANESVLSYTSIFYPGFNVEVDAYLAGVDPKYARAGFYLDFTQGFDSLSLEDSDGNITTVSISHTDLEGGALFRLFDPLDYSAPMRARAYVNVGVRYSGFSIAENAALPSTSHTSFVLGASFDKPLGDKRIELHASTQIMPASFYNNGLELFGNSSFGYGFAAELGPRYWINDDLGILATYEMRVERTLFEGDGEADFVDASGFELVQGLSGGVFYRY